MLYYGSKISNNITKTPEGYLICMNVPINRTGTQDYLGSELMLDEDMDANERISIIRDEKDVFDKATLASFEGKPVTNDHPDEDLDLSNNEMYQVGHCQNVRREGDFTVADLYITNPQMVNDIENGKREISCGYTCDFIPDGNGNYKQTNIRGNHIAVVNSGRAGEKVRIIDSNVEDGAIDKVMNENKYAIMYKDKNGKYCVKKKKDNSVYEYQTPNKAYAAYHRFTEVNDSSINDEQSKGFTNALRTINRRDMTKQRFLENAEALYQTRAITENEYNELKKLGMNMKDSSVNNSKVNEYKNRLRKPIKWTEAAIINKEARNDNSLTPKEKYKIDMFYNEMQNKKMYKSAFDSKGIKDSSSEQDLIKRKKELEDWLKKYSGDYTHFDNMEDYRHSIKEAENEISQLENKIRSVKDMSYKQKVKDSLIPLKEKLIGSMVPFKQKIKDSLVCDSYKQVLITYSDGKEKMEFITPEEIKTIRRTKQYNGNEIKNIKVYDSNIKHESSLYNEFCKKLQNFHSWSYDFARVGDAIKTAYKNNELSKEEYDKLVKLYSEKDFSFSG